MSSAVWWGGQHMRSADLPLAERAGRPAVPGPLPELCAVAGWIPWRHGRQ